MSVKQENRYRKLVINQGRASADRQREIEAAFMPRQPRIPAPPATATVASRAQVRAWMRREASAYDTATALAEAANIALDLPPGAMDDETHWVWEEAMQAVERISV